MWRLGFRVWRAGLVLKYGLPALLVLVLLYLAQGLSPLFLTVLCLFGLVAGGASFALREFEEREIGRPEGRRR
ncbi:hypothetical protein [Saccharomonospora iraqiensis]|uniref:hypothetical protein n=1 Tax=Saccharomonospora iraqiensis TaxID=52698 RepID=UPI00047BCE20|nr:hypothetical protein [Saccharomonospora iraqiensis]